MGVKSGIIEAFVIPFVVQFFKDLMTQENIQLYGDKLFDMIEDLVTNSETHWDDAIVLPLVKQFRETLNIPDLPDGE